jgi:hypothetical protein
MVLAAPATAFAQAQQGSGPAANPADTPSIRVGATLFADYGYSSSPETVDADGNAIHPSAFNVSRSYINITGNVSHIVAFRLTPDIARETGAGSSLNGSLTFRIKYAFAQFNLDDWLPRGSWTRLGIQQTPWVDFEEGIYRYRFQGTVFVEREGFMSSSDAGASFHTNVSDYAEIHAGVYNGENYNHAEANDQKALQLRASVRPLAHGEPAALRGLRVHLFYDHDAYVRDADRRRLVSSITFEHRLVNAGFDYLRAADQPSVTRAEVDGRGFSLWATPKAPNGWEALLRYDHLEPDAGVQGTRTRTILGAAYWFPHEGNVSTALLFDVDGQTFHNTLPAQPRQRRIAVHGLVNF